LPNSRYTRESFEKARATLGECIEATGPTIAAAAPRGNYNLREKPCC